MMPEIGWENMERQWAGRAHIECLLDNVDIIRQMDMQDVKYGRVDVS